MNKTRYVSPASVEAVVPIPWLADVNDGDGQDLLLLFHDELVVARRKAVVAWDVTLHIIHIVPVRLRNLSGTSQRDRPKWGMRSKSSDT